MTLLLAVLVIHLGELAWWWYAVAVVVYLCEYLHHLGGLRSAGVLPARVPAPGSPKARRAAAQAAQFQPTPPQAPTPPRYAPAPDPEPDRSSADPIDEERIKAMLGRPLGRARIIRKPTRTRPVIHTAAAQDAPADTTPATLSTVDMIARGRGAELIKQPQTVSDCVARLVEIDQAATRVTVDPELASPEVYDEIFKYQQKVFGVYKTLGGTATDIDALLARTEVL